MKLYTTGLAALFGLLTMATPSVTRADVGPRALPPVVVQQTVAPMSPVALAYYHRPWACANPRFRRHHPFLCW